MTITRTPTRRAGAFVAIAIAGLALVASACGGGSSKSTSDAVSKALTGVSGSCLKFSEDFSKAVSSASSSMSSNGTDDIATIAKNLDSMTSSVPSEIRDDWKAYVDFFKQYADAMKGVNMDDLASDPTAMQKMSNALSTLNDSKYQTAVTNLSNYFSNGCKK